MYFLDQFDFFLKESMWRIIYNEGLQTCNVESYTNFYIIDNFV